MNYLREVAMQSYAQGTPYLSPESYNEMKFKQNARERDLLSSMHAQAILIDELLRGYEQPGGGELIICRRDTLSYLLSSTSLGSHSVDYLQFNPQAPQASLDYLLS